MSRENMSNLNLKGGLKTCSNRMIKAKKSSMNNNLTRNIVFN